MFIYEHFTAPLRLLPCYVQTEALVVAAVRIQHMFFSFTVVTLHMHHHHPAELLSVLVSAKWKTNRTQEREGENVVCLEEMGKEQTANSK